MPRMGNSVILILAAASGLTAFLISLSLVKPKEPAATGYMVVAAM